MLSTQPLSIAIVNYEQYFILEPCFDVSDIMRLYHISFLRKFYYRGTLTKVFYIG
jgi:hypothetical protein